MALLTRSVYMHSSQQCRERSMEYALVLNESSKSLLATCASTDHHLDPDLLARNGIEFND